MEGCVPCAGSAVGQARCPRAGPGRAGQDGFQQRGQRSALRAGCTRMHMYERSRVHTHSPARQTHGDALGVAVPAVGAALPLKRS